MAESNRLRRWAPAWLFAALLAGDLALNVLTGGTPGQTVSERVARARSHGSPIGYAACAALEALERDHCTHVLSKGQ